MASETRIPVTEMFEDTDTMQCRSHADMGASTTAGAVTLGMRRISNLISIDLKIRHGFRLDGYSLSAG